VRSEWTKEQEALFGALEEWFSILDARERRERGLPIRIAGAHAMRDFGLVKNLYAQN
jgi:hypothetical protein